MVPHQGGVITRWFRFTNRVYDANWPPQKSFLSWRLNISNSSKRMVRDQCSNRQIWYSTGSQFTLSSQMIKPNYNSFSVNVSRLVRNPQKTTHTLVPEIINNLYGIDILHWGLNQEPPSFSLSGTQCLKLNESWYTSQTRTTSWGYTAKAVVKPESERF